MNNFQPLSAWTSLCAKTRFKSSCIETLIGTLHSTQLELNALPLARNSKLRGDQLHDWRLVSLRSRRTLSFSCPLDRMQVDGEQSEGEKGDDPNASYGPQLLINNDPNKDTASAMGARRDSDRLKQCKGTEIRDTMKERPLSSGCGDGRSVGNHLQESECVHQRRTDTKSSLSCKLESKERRSEFMARID